ncbi:uncharacterized protein LOC113146851 [Cyclospora cayetanensis]|uniref:Uncharacterized protein LOC113146851 n=1 Tax=Cyclospora cayetanensis TaxID=88456 RepID=A0A6P6RTS2_9EIME|nr:uncharacterized protein LOC113146851 [Cyclospora cayetanensis]
MAAALIGLLNEAAGEYVEGLERSQLDFSGILTGKVLLRHLQLKKKAFEVLPLPVRPEFNYIGLVQLDLPVYSLGTAPILGELKDVLVLLSVESSGNWNAEDFLRHYHERKAAALAAGEYKALFSSLERGAWEAGVLGTLERARASPLDTQRYLLCWPVKLLRYPQPMAVLKDAELLLLSKDDAELASKAEKHSVALQPLSGELPAQAANACKVCLSAKVQCVVVSPCTLSRIYADV